jgi:putative ABC transport system ATP-binding protein
MLEVADLRRIGLKPASFTLASGECVAVRGPSGAGKTLLLRAIADLDPNEGRVLLDGRDRDTIPAPEWRRRVVYLPAEPGWWADGVGEHFPAWEAAAPLLGELGIAGNARDWPVSRCSTGERLRLALVRALMAKPGVLLLDEPTAALDTAAVSAAEAMIGRYVQAGMSALWVTHDGAQADRVARRVLLVDSGEVREQGTP